MANTITCIRIVCALALIFCPVFSARFFVLYIIGGISDVLDGIAARRLGKETRFGAQLDMIADAVFFVIVIIKAVLPFRFPIWILIWFACIAVIKCINVIIGLIRYKRIISEHTVMNKICGVLLFLFPLCIGQLPRRAVEALVILICCAATFAVVQEGYYIRTGKEIK